MKTFSLITTAAMFLGLAALSQADGHSEHQDAASAMRQYAAFNKIGNPADVLTVKAAAPQALESGEARVRVLAAPINPADLLQIAGQYGVAAVLPAKPAARVWGELLK